MPTEDALKDELRRTWDGVADAWDRWYDQFERDAQPINDWICDGARLAPGMKVLDLASGSGQPAFTASSRVGPAGLVVATDMAPAMVEVVSRRAADSATMNIQALVMDMERLEFDPESFDAITCRWGFMWPRDHVRAIEEAYRVLGSGGWLATATWDKGYKNPLRGASVLQRVSGSAAPSPARFGVRFDDPPALAAMFEAAGFINVSVEVVGFVTEYESFEAWWEYSTDAWTTVRRRLSGLSAEELASVKERARAEVEKFRLGEKLVGPGSCLCLSAQKP